MAEIYAGRSLAVYVLRFNVRRKPDEMLDPLNLEGRKITDLLHEYCAGKTSELRQVGSSDRFVVFRDCREFGDGLLVRLESGRAGERGRVVDVLTAQVGYEYDEDDATMVRSRVLLDAVPGYDYALMFVEHVNGGAGDVTVPNLLKGYLGVAVPNVVMTREPFLEGKALETIAAVEKVEVRRYLTSSDPVDPLVVDGSSLTTVLGHRRGATFPPALLSNILKGRDGMAPLFGLHGSLVDPEEDGVQVMVEVKAHDGRTKKFTLGDGIEMPLREVLNEPGRAPLEDRQFVDKCRESEHLILDKLGRKGR